MMNWKKGLSQNILLKVLSLLLMVMIVLSIIPLHQAAAEDVDNSPIIVSLGDSYSSGEGIEPFYGQFDEDIAQKINNPDWIAHRSQKAWPGMLKLPSIKGRMSDHRDQNWFFCAASGATTEHILNDYHKPYNKDNGKYKGSYPLPQQRSAFDNLKGKHTKYVTLTLGGNDADFEGIITTAVFSNSYLNPNGLSDKFNHTWQEFFRNNGIRDNLYHAYRNIAEKAGSQAHIIVAGYPKLIDPAGSPPRGEIINKKEAALINENVTKFNQAIQSIVNTCQGEGMQISFVSVEEAFEGHGVYSKDPYIKDIHLGSSSEDCEDNLIASKYSMHPNEKGAHAYAKCVQHRINELEGIWDGIYNNNFSVSVYDRDDKLYDNYKIQISGKEYRGFLNIPIFYKNYSKKIDVSSSKEEKITLPNGEYTITVSDASDESKTSSKNIKINSESKNDNLLFMTEFGEEKNHIEIGAMDYLIRRSQQNTLKSPSEERNIVLTLDVSGSMSGTPIEETKKASEKFINTVLEKDASIGIVTYEENAMMASGLSVDKISLQRIVSDLRSGGGTNMEAGLRDAEWMLEKTNAKKKIIVLMSDGEPNVGLQGEDLITYADKIKNSGILIYTIGFFESMNNSNYKSSAQDLMERIASDGCHYEVATADELVFFFEDMADQINGQQYIYVRIACPVDVSVTNNGETLNSSGTSTSARTSFGTLTFEENKEEKQSRTDDRVKILRLKKGEDYELQLTGTGQGTMNYTIGFMDDNGEYTDLRKFENINITNKTKIDTVAADSNESIMDIDENGDGEIDKRLRAEANGNGKEIPIIGWQIYVGIGVALMVLIGIISAILYFNRKR